MAWICKHSQCIVCGEPTELSVYDAAKASTPDDLYFKSVGTPRQVAVMTLAYHVECAEVLRACYTAVFGTPNFIYKGNVPQRGSLPTVTKQEDVYLYKD